MASPAAIERVDVVEEGALPDDVHAVVNGVENGIEKIEDCIVHTDLVNGVENVIEKNEDCIDGLVDVKHFIESFTSSLPFNQDSKPGSDQENLGNNIYLPSPSPNSAPCRFGLHIKKDDLGYRIARIFQDTFAHHAKLQENDILTHLDDTELSSKDIVKVIALFSTVGNPFSLTILRKMESGERTEIVIQITTNIDEVERSIEIQVTVRGPQYTLDRCDPMPPSYITQDLDGGSQQYVNIASNGNLVMGHEQVPFVFEKYFTIYSDGPLLSTLKTTDGDRVFDFSQQKMVPSNPEGLLRYMMIVRADNDGSSVFEQFDRQGNNDKRFINNSNNQIVVSRLESPNSVPMSGRFVTYSADDEATTTTTNRPGGGRTRHVNGAH